MIRRGGKRPAFLVAAALAAALSQAACTTSALRGVGAPPAPSALAPEPVAIDPVALAPQQQPAVTPMALAPEPALAAPVPPAPDMAANRAEAIGQIRSKAAGTGSNKPNIFAPPAVPADRMTAEEQKAIRAEMAAAAARNQAALAPTEAQAKAAEARRLKERARTHYNQALKQIEN